MQISCCNHTNIAARSARWLVTSSSKVLAKTAPTAQCLNKAVHKASLQSDNTPVTDNSCIVACLQLRRVLQAVRAKRSAASKDTLPDEVFHRIRGALFFGPGFKVTRNKLLFRDNLQELLAAAVPGLPS